MPIHLYHGRASQKKKKLLQDLFIQNANNSILLTASHLAVKFYREQICENQKNGVLIGQRIFTLEEFLLLFIKKNNSRIHLIDESLSQQALYFIFKKKFPKLLQKQNDLLEFLNHFLHFYRHIKSFGLTPQKAKQIFKEDFFQHTVIPIFSDFQSWLEKYYYADSAELFLKTLTSLHEGTPTLPLDVQNIFINDIYPLLPSHRELLAALKKRFPQLNIIIFYDEDFSRQSDLISLAYEELGQLADNVTHVNFDEKLEQQNLCTIIHPTPFHEIQFVLNYIKYHQIKSATLVLLNQDYETELSKSLAKQGLKHQSYFTKPLNSFFNSTPTANKIFWQTLVAEYKKKPSKILELKIQAYQTLYNFQEQLSFQQKILADFESFSQTDFIKLSQETLETLSFKPKPNDQPFVICSLDDALFFKRQTVFVLGCNLKNLLQKEQNHFYSHLMMDHPKFAELFLSKQYRFKIKLEKLKHTIDTQPQTVLTQSVQGFDGKESSELPFELPKKYFIFTDTTAVISSSQQKFSTIPKDIFSVSEIQTYLNCPYQYYGKKHLNLELKTENLFEPEPHIKGKMIHKIMQRLIEENQKQYENVLISPEELAAFEHIISAIITEESKNFLLTQNYKKSVISSFLTKLKGSIKSIILLESLSYKEENKKTVAKYYEWDFSHPENILLIENKNQQIKIRGRVDRIDMTADGAFFSIIDYKTGSAPTMKNLIEGKEIQMPLYALAFKQKFLQQKIVSGLFYYSLKENKISGLTTKDSADEKAFKKTDIITQDELENIEKKVIANVCSAVENINQGNFLPKPLESKICDYCDFKNFCGYDFPNK